MTPNIFGLQIFGLQIFAKVGGIKKLRSKYGKL